MIQIGDVVIHIDWWTASVGFVGSLCMIVYTLAKQLDERPGLYLMARPLPRRTFWTFMKSWMLATVAIVVVSWIAVEVVVQAYN